MRDFFINSLEKLIGVIIIVMGVGVIIGSFAVAFGSAGQGGGLFAGLLFFVFGAIYVVLMGGFMYLGVGIYQNTLRTAKAIERMSADK